MEEKINTLISLMLSIGPHFKKTFSLICKENVKLALNQKLVFNYILLNRNSSMSTISKNTGISNQQLTRIISDLQKLGLITKFKDPNNKRLIIADITPEGLKYHEKSHEYMKDALKQYLSKFNEKELDTLIANFSSIIELINK